MKRLIFLLLFLPIFSYSQNMRYAKSVIDTLCSPYMAGRGYSKNGDKLAADYIASEMKRSLVSSIKRSYLQNFNLDVNVFRKNMKVKIGQMEMKPGVDFIVDPASASAKGKYKILVLNNAFLNNNKKYNKLKSMDLSNKFILIDTVGVRNKEFLRNFDKIVHKNTLGAKGVILVEDKLIFSSSQTQNSFAGISIKRSSVPVKLRKIEIDVDAELIKNYTTQNVIARIRGKVDTCIVFTAHYDHLGIMGPDVFFPGAHDNASGCAMVMDLAKEYIQRKCISHYSLVFLFFSGEEIGLLGSKYFVENPWIDLSKVKFLLNFDIVGSGDKGIQVVNSTIFKDEYKRLLKINEKNKYLPEIATRGAAANSDHYFFYKKGVPCFYIYSLGKYKEYHNVYDTRENVPLTGYESIYKLVSQFVDQLNREATGRDCY